ncbi:ATP-binding protein [Streptomyces calidiresistens]
MAPAPSNGGNTAPGPRAPRLTAALDGIAGDIARARHLTADFLTRPHPDPAPSPRVVEIARLVVSELVTNACKYAPGPLVMELRLTGAALRIEVRDSAPMTPAARTADPTRVGRHGLEIVTALTGGVEVRPESNGKRVIAHLPLRPDPPPDPAPGTPPPR